MKYQEYIDLGFKRIDINDSVEYQETGYYGYILTKNITDTLCIEVHFRELDKPKMYITKQHNDGHHIIPISTDMIVGLLSNKK